MGSTPEGSPASGIGRARALDDEIHRAITEAEGFDLITMGRGEGPRCYCYVNNILRRSLDGLARSYEFVLLDNEAIDASKAYLGASVRVLNKKTDEQFTYTLVSPVEADLAGGKISVQSPVGKALLGHSAGETVVAKVPAGMIEFEILEIAR